MSAVYLAVLIGAVLLLFMAYKIEKIVYKRK
jgi:hypothetical protein